MDCIIQKQNQLHTQYVKAFEYIFSVPHTKHFKLWSDATFREVIDSYLSPQSVLFTTHYPRRDEYWKRGIYMQLLNENLINHFWLCFLSPGKKIHKSYICVCIVVFVCTVPHSSNSYGARTVFFLVMHAQYPIFCEWNTLVCNKACDWLVIFHWQLISVIKFM